MRIELKSWIMKTVPKLRSYTEIMNKEEMITEPSPDQHLGAMDEYGNLQALQPNGTTINTAVTYSTNQTINNRIGIVKNGTLTITGTTTLSGDAVIRVCENGTLIVDGGTLQNAKLDLIPGSHVVVRNNGTINMASGRRFDAPIGVVVDIQYGSIN